MAGAARYLNAESRSEATWEGIRGAGGDARCAAWVQAFVVRLPAFAAAFGFFPAALVRAGLAVLAAM